MEISRAGSSASPDAGPIGNFLQYPYRGSSGFRPNCKGHSERRPAKLRPGRDRSWQSHVHGRSKLGGIRILRRRTDWPFDSVFPGTRVIFRYDYSSGIQFHGKSIPTAFSISVNGQAVIEARTIAVSDPPTRCRCDVRYDGSRRTGDWPVHESEHAHDCLDACSRATVSDIRCRHCHAGRDFAWQFRPEWRPERDRNPGEQRSGPEPDGYCTSHRHGAETRR